MTEVAQVAAGVAHDMDDITNEDEHNMSDAENRDDDVTNESDEDDASKEEHEKMSHMEEEEPCCVNDKASSETDKRSRNGVTHKDTISEEDGRSKAVNGVAQDAKADEEQNISDLALKKEVSEACMLIDKISSVMSLTEITSNFYIIFLSTETPQIPKAGGQKLRAKAEQGQGRCDKQV